MDLEHAEIGRPLAPLAPLAVAASCGGGAAEHLGVKLQHARGGEEDDDLVPGWGWVVGLWGYGGMG